jgi:hypothetical protein
LATARTLLLADAPARTGRLHGRERAAALLIVLG